MTIKTNPHRPLASSSINIKQIRLSLQFYMESWDFLFVDDKSKISGIKIFDHILALAKEYEEYDRRVFHLLYEHSLFMKRRVSYLSQNNLLNCHRFDLAPFTQLKNNALIMRNMVLKHQLTHDISLFQRIEQLLLDFKAMQIKLFTDLICMIDNC